MAVLVAGALALAAAGTAAAATLQKQAHHPRTVYGHRQHRSATAASLPLQPPPRNRSAPRDLIQLVELLARQPQRDRTQPTMARGQNSRHCHHGRAYLFPAMFPTQAPTRVTPGCTYQPCRTSRIRTSTRLRPVYADSHASPREVPTKRHTQHRMITSRDDQHTIANQKEGVLHLRRDPIEF